MAIFGVPEDRLVYVLSGTDANDHYYVGERDDLCSSPAIRLAGARALELAGVAAAELDDPQLVGFIDLCEASAHWFERRFRPPTAHSGQSPGMN